MLSLLPMDNATDILVHGWMPAPDRRGSGDVLWSCGMTILLCCWVSVYPNVGSPSDKWYHPFLDKLNLFCIALLGPDFLLALRSASGRKQEKVSRLVICDSMTVPSHTSPILFAHIRPWTLAISKPPAVTKQDRVEIRACILR